MKAICCVLALGSLLWAAVAGEPAVVPLPQAHSHNDYEHARPLLDALDHGFCSVEADIFAIEGKLLVAHDRSRVHPERTLQSLYLDPLRARVRANQGRVYPAGPDFFLLIDFKTDADATWPVLRAVLDEYADMLTTFTADETRTNAVTVVLSGDSPRAALAKQPLRRAAIDGRPSDLSGSSSRHLVPWISENWSSLFSWRGEGEMPAKEISRLNDFVRQAHAQGRRVRFWGARDTDSVWQVQHAAGVDFLNADKLAELRRYLVGLR